MQTTSKHSSGNTTTESVNKLVAAGVVTVDSNGDVRMTESAWMAMVTPNETNGKVEPAKKFDVGVPRKKGQTDHGE